jgi:putative phosphonate metabolism protein
MIMAPRYAIYFVPDPNTALYRFGSAVLGYDCFTGAEIPTLDALPVDTRTWRELTRAPRRYGFHATLKAPFRLAPGQTEAELISKLVEFSRTITRAPTIEPAICLLHHFVAITPANVCAGLGGLAASCVKHFDGFRAPLTSADRSRRLAAHLTSRQIEHLERWGYPYIFDDFRFHMTLTGGLAAGCRQAMLAYLQRRLTCSQADGPISIDRLALLRQDYPGGRFVVLAHHAMSEVGRAAAPGIRI